MRYHQKHPQSAESLEMTCEVLIPTRCFPHAMEYSLKMLKAEKKNGWLSLMSKFFLVIKCQLWNACHVSLGNVTRERWLRAKPPPPQHSAAVPGAVCTRVTGLLLRLQPHLLSMLCFLFLYFPLEDLFWGVLCRCRSHNSSWSVGMHS